MVNVEFRLDGDVAILSIDNPPVNGLGQAIRAQLISAIDTAEADPAIRAIVITGKGRLFCAGADIREFGTPPQPPSLPAALDRIEACAKPVAAALFGVAAGGGLELALACHWRIAASATRVGLPEVTLGIVPGAGGTQRLPRVIGAEQAVEMITQGDLRRIETLAGTGLVDAIVSPDRLLAEAVAFARAKADTRSAPQRTSERPVAGGVTKIRAYREKQRSRWRGFDAPDAAAALVEQSLTLPFDQGMKAEREVYLRLVGSDQAQAMRHVFFAEREATRLPSDLPSVHPMPIQRAAVIGAGTMGGGIAMNFLNVGRPVVLLDTTQNALDRGIAIIRKNYERSLSSGKLSRQDVEQRMSLLTGTLNYDALSDADIIIEAIFEDMSIKKKVFSELDRVAKPGAILATNTSTLDVDEIATATRRPESVVGTHFFSPANVMKLMENVRGKRSSPEAVATIMQLGKDLGKVPVLVGVCFGFVGNRMLYAYTRQANVLIEEGCTPEQVDRAVHDFGMPMGPFQMSDLTGIDVGYAIRKANRSIMVPDGMRGFTVADRLAERGRLGQKGGTGWYVYDENRRQGSANPEVAEIIRDVMAERGMAPRSHTDREIVERCFFPLVNEGAKILAEGVATRASDIDVIWTTGYGFPRHRGGPMFWADQIGLDVVLAGMKRLHEEVGEWCRPAPLLETLVKENRKFSDWTR